MKQVAVYTKSRDEQSTPANEQNGPKNLDNIKDSCKSGHLENVCYYRGDIAYLQRTTLTGCGLLSDQQSSQTRTRHVRTFAHLQYYVLCLLKGLQYVILQLRRGIRVYVPVNSKLYAVLSLDLCNGHVIT